jgi:hypothetical protein
MEPKTQIAVPRQLALTLDSLALRGLPPTERAEVVVLLAQLLQEASGMVEREDDDEYV